MATVANFDDLLGSSLHMTSLQLGLPGLYWNEVGFLNAALRNPPAGYPAGTVTPPNVAYNWFAHDATITPISAQELMNFEGAYFGAAWNNGLTITLEGLRNGGLIDTRLRSSLIHKGQRGSPSTF